MGRGTCVAFIMTAAQAQDKKPNILFIMGDDIGWMQPSCYHRGLMVGETPNIDRIANEGAIFMHYYAEQSCTAGRNAFFTGMHPLRTGMIPPQLPGSPSYLRPGTPALAKFLHDLGYTTGEFGKNHLGDHTAALPTAHGFEEFWGYLYHLDAMQGVSFPDINKTPAEQGVAPPCKNTPIPGLPEVPGAVEPRTTTCLTPRRPVLWCHSSDATESFTFPDGGITPFKGSKMNTWEGGMRAPCVMRWPGHIKPGTVYDDIFASLDWVPTFVDIAGGPKGDGLKQQIEAGKYPGIVKTTLDGVNQRAYLEGTSPKSARDTFFYYSSSHPSTLLHKNTKRYFPIPP